MAEFTADTAQLESIAGQLKSLGSHIDGVASRVYSTGQGVGGLKSLKNKGYVGMIHDVRTSLRSIADDAALMSKRLAQISNAYVSNEIEVSGVFANTAIISSVESNNMMHSTGKPHVLDESIGADIIKGALDAYDEARGVETPGEFIDWFHRLRAGVGGKFVDAAVNEAKKYPLIGSTMEYWIDYANKKAKKYETIAKGFFNPKNIDEIAAGFSTFSSEALGIPDFAKISNKYDLRNNSRIKTANELIQHEFESQGRAYAFAGMALTIGEIITDTSFQAARFAYKFLNPGAGQTIKAVNHLVGVLTGKGAEDWIDAGLGSVGNWFQSSLSGFAKAVS